MFSVIKEAGKIIITYENDLQLNELKDIMKIVETFENLEYEVVVSYKNKLD